VDVLELLSWVVVQFGGVSYAGTVFARATASKAD